MQDAQLPQSAMKTLCARLKTKRSGSLLVALLAGAAAFLLEYVRVEPTFGIGIHLWLFFPLLVLVLLGSVAAMAVALLAVGLQLIVNGQVFTLFDAMLYLINVGTCCCVVFRTQQMRIVDGILLSWLITIPISVGYYQAYFQYGLNAGCMVLSAQLLSQLLPAMLVQWLAFRPAPLAPFLPQATSLINNKPIGLQDLLRNIQLPTVLVFTLTVADFITTQAVAERVALEESLAIQRAHIATRATRQALATSDAETPQALVTAIQQTLELTLPTQAKATGHDQNADDPISLVARSVSVAYVDQVAQPLFIDTPGIVQSPSPNQSSRTSMDWLYQQGWLVFLPLKDHAFPGFIRLYEPVGEPARLDHRSMLWGLSATLLLLAGMLGVYRRWVRKGIESAEQSLATLVRWQPGNDVQMLQPFRRGRVIEVDTLKDKLSSMIDGFNTNYRALDAMSAERAELLAQLRAIQSAVHEPILVVDSEFKVLTPLCNHAGRQWSQILQADLTAVARFLAQPGSDNLSVSELSAFARVVLEALTGQDQSNQANLRLTDEHGAHHDFQLSVGRIDLPGSQASEQSAHAPNGLVILLSDVSALIGARRELEHKHKLAALGSLATGASHELNQPLNAMRMALANLHRRLEAHTVDDAFLAQKITRLNTQVSRMGVLISAMRAFSANDNTNPVLLNPSEVLDHCLQLMAHSLKSSHIELEVSSCHEPVAVKSNRNLLGRLFTEVLKNAIEALSVIDDRPRTLRVTEMVRDTCWAVSIEDNGCGFDASQTDNLFEPFYTTKDDVKHAGMGLTSAWQITEELGGVITVDCEAGLTVVRIEIPIA